MNIHREKLRVMAQEFIELSAKREEQRFRVTVADLTPQERSDAVLRFTRKHDQLLRQLNVGAPGASPSNALLLEARHIEARLRALN